MKRKGFTLIELLAVIVILAVIALIAIPVVLNMIESARKSAARSSALGYIDAIEYNNGFATLGSDANLTETYTKVESGDISGINIKFKGKKPDSGNVTVDPSGKVTEAELCINGYKVKYENRDAKVIGKCSSSSEDEDNSSYVVYDNYYRTQELYYNPVTNSYCDSKDTSNNCYSWAVINPNLSNDKIELFLLDDVSNYRVSSTSAGSQPTTTIIDELNTITSTWSSDLSITNSDYSSVTSTEAGTVTIDFSNSKARVLYKSELNTEILVKMKDNSTCGVNNYPCTILYNGSEGDSAGSFTGWGQINFSNFSTYTASVTRTGGPLGSGGLQSNFFIHPVIEVNKKTTSVTVKNKIKTIDKTNKNNEGTSMEGLIGVVYLDPTNLEKECSSSDASSNVNSNNTPTGITNGCMKWYIYGENGNNYKMILDHNTSGNVSWNGSYSENNAEGMLEVIERLIDDTKGWKVNSRLITANELATIVNFTAFDVNDTTAMGFYLDGTGDKKQTATAKSKGASKYSWLYDYTQRCEANGCSIEDNSQYPFLKKDYSESDTINGYWTSTANPSQSSSAWSVIFYGNVSNGSIFVSRNFGVRPVIELPKKMFK